MEGMTADDTNTVMMEPPLVMRSLLFGGVRFTVMLGQLRGGAGVWVTPESCTPPLSTDLRSI